MTTPIEQRYIDLHPASMERFGRSKDLFPDGVTHDARRLRPFPMYVTHAKGSQKWDVDGHRIIDYKTGHGAMILGHSHPAVVSAVKEAMEKGTQMGSSTDAEIRWGELVRELVPCAEKVRFQSSGTEAVMMALRLARAFTGKTKVVKFDDHFHGWSDYALAGGSGLGGIPKETLDTMIVLPPDDIDLVEKTLTERDDIAALMLEPTGSHMGLHPISPEFLGRLREITERTGVLLLMDEVVTGFRLSRGGASRRFDVTPDLTTMAKILGGGLPGGAVAGRAEIINLMEFHNDADYDANERVSHPGTFNANPLSAAAGVAALELVRDGDVNERADAAADRLKEGINDLLGRMEIPGQMTGHGSLLFLRLGVDIEVEEDGATFHLTDEDWARVNDGRRNSQLHLALLNNGVDPMSNGTRLIVGQAHSERDIDETVDAYEKSLAEVRELGLV